MEDKKILNNEELEKVNGGVSFNVNGSNLEIILDPNESAVEELQNKLASGIKLGIFNVAVEDPSNFLMNAAYTLDQPDKIGLSRKCIVAYTLRGMTVVVEGVTISC